MEPYVSFSISDSTTYFVLFQNQIIRPVLLRPLQQHFLLRISNQRLGNKNVFFLHRTLHRAAKSARKFTVTRPTARTFRTLLPLHFSSPDNVTSPTVIQLKFQFSKLSRSYKDIAGNTTLKIRTLFINVLILPFCVFTLSYPTQDTFCLYLCMHI